MSWDEHPEFRSPLHAYEVRVPTWQDAEELACWHMREYLGFSNAHLTGSGPDMGLDVVAIIAAAQVKYHASPAGSPDVQRLVGAGHNAAVHVFYSLSGFSRSAQVYAEEAGVALFEYTIYGDVTPANGVAQALLQAGRLERTPEKPDEGAPDLATQLAETDLFAEALSAALVRVEQTRETDIPGVYVCAEVSVQLAVSREVHLDGGATAEHEALDRDIADFIQGGDPCPSAWIPKIHEWDKRRMEALAGDDARTLARLHILLCRAGAIRRWPLSVGADMAYLKLYEWPQRGWISEEVAERLVALDPLRRGRRWCRGAMRHVNHDLPYMHVDMNIRYYDELVPDVGGWRAMLQLDPPESLGGPLWG